MNRIYFSSKTSDFFFSDFKGSLLQNLFAETSIVKDAENRGVTDGCSKMISERSFNLPNVKQRIFLDQLQNPITVIFIKSSSSRSGAIVLLEQLTGMEIRYPGRDGFWGEVENVGNKILRITKINNSVHRVNLEVIRGVAAEKSLAEL
eukprot:Lithocolla_globosa_v1_NODE_4081_length_1515_cov_38.621233.p2 type:complete len:148 gc:universal NODE_4081_length_1515_cov_38.621233:800-1243(+)